MNKYFSFRKKTGDAWAVYLLDRTTKSFEDKDLIYFKIEKSGEIEVIGSTPYIENNKYKLDISTGDIEDVTQEIYDKNLLSLKESKVDQVNDISDSILNGEIDILLNGFNLKAFKLLNLINLVTDKENLTSTTVSIRSNNNVISIEGITKEVVDTFKKQLFKVKEDVEIIKSTCISKIRQITDEEDINNLVIEVTEFDSDNVTNGLIRLSVDAVGVSYINLKDGLEVTDISELEKLLKL